MLKIQHVFHIVLVIIFLLPCLSYGEATQTETKETIKVFIYPTQISRGETREIFFKGKNLSAIQSVEITPPEDISVKEIKEAVLTEDEKKKGEKRWVIQFQVIEDAKLVPRSVVLVTPQGRSKPVSVDIVSYPPRISDLNISSAKYGTDIEFMFNVFDESGDVGTNTSVYTVVSCGLLETIKPSRIIAILGGSSILKVISDMKMDNFDTRGGPGWSFVIGKCNEVEKKDVQNCVMRGKISLGSTKASGACMLTILIMDKNGYMSNDLEAPVEF